MLSQLGQTILKLIKDLRRAGAKIPVVFPEHLFIPESNEGIDIVENCELERATGNASEDLTRLITLRPNQAEEFFITHYALYTDLEDAEDIEFFFKVNGKRVLRFHGRPDDAFNPTRYILNVGLGPDLSNDTLKNCQIHLTPNDTFTIEVETRNSRITAPVGVRLVGYILNENQKSARLKR